MTHATLRSDVEDRYTLSKGEFWSDGWVWAWFRGNATDCLFLEDLIVADDGTVDRQHGGGIERVVEIVCARLSGSFVKMNHLSARDDFDMSKELSNHRVERLHHWTAVEYLVRSR